MLFGGEIQNPFVRRFIEIELACLKAILAAQFALGLEHLRIKTFEIIGQSIVRIDIGRCQQIF